MKGRMYMKRILILLLTGALLLSACTLGQTQTATSTPPPTIPPATPTEAEPTDTPAPPTETAPPATATETATPTETEPPTPTVEATPDPERGVGDIVFEERFDGASGWNWSFTEEDVVSFQRDGDELAATMFESGSGWRATIGPPGIVIGDQQTRLTIRTDSCANGDEYGLIFRSAFNEEESTFDGYLFAINCAGQAQVSELDNSQRSVLLDWQPSAAINAGAPADNTLLIWAADEELNFYVNDEYVGTVSDDSLAQGGYGLYLRDRSGGGASVVYDDLIVREVDLP
jgi:hypothetical protein